MTPICVLRAGAEHQNGSLRAETCSLQVTLTTGLVPTHGWMVWLFEVGLKGLFS